MGHIGRQGVATEFWIQPSFSQDCILANGTPKCSLNLLIPCPGNQPLLIIFNELLPKSFMCLLVIAAFPPSWWESLSNLFVLSPWPQTCPCLRVNPCKLPVSCLLWARAALLKCEWRHWCRFHLQDQTFSLDPLVLAGKCSYNVT